MCVTVCTCSWHTHFLVSVLKLREEYGSQGYELTFRQGTVILNQGRRERREGGGEGGKGRERGREGRGKEEGGEGEEEREGGKCV